MSEKEKPNYLPGDYGQERQLPADWADIHIKNRDMLPCKKTKPLPPNAIYPCICFSRQIGVGALKIADLLARRLPMRVVDREVLEFMTQEKDLTNRAEIFFNETHPGAVDALLSSVLSQRPFLKGDYALQLAKNATVLAGLEPTIFVGRGIHLILPRQSVLAVRVIADKEYRVSRLSRMFGITVQKAEKQIDRLDQEQTAFFKKNYNHNDADPEKFDLVINKKYLPDESQAMEIISCAFEHKFGHL